MIRNTIFLPVVLVLFSACMAGSGPAPVEYKGARVVGPMGVSTAQTPASMPDLHHDPAPVIPDEPIAQGLEGLTEAEELQMLDVEPAPIANTSKTADELPNDPQNNEISATHSLTAEEEMDMLDVEPGSMAPVELQPKIDTAPSAEVTQAQIQDQASGAATQGRDVEIVLTKDRPASVKVQTGDTLFSLSEKYQVALQPLIELNNLRKPYDLNKGQTLKLPPPLHYRVQKGDTLYSIARKYNIHFQSLAGINGIEKPFVISPNAILVLPALARDNEGKWKAAPLVSSKSSTNTKSDKPSSGDKSPAPTVIKPAANSTFIWPVRGKILSRFGGKAGGMRNDGINIAADPMTEIVAAGSGTVIYSGSELKNFGRLILIRHDNGWVTAYAHNSAAKVLEGAKVTQGQVIALAGSTGSVDVSQLHFETRKGVKPVDPLKHLPKI